MQAVIGMGGRTGRGRCVRLDAPGGIGAAVFARIRVGGHTRRRTLNR